MTLGGPVEGGIAPPLAMNVLAYPPSPTHLLISTRHSPFVEGSSSFSGLGCDSKEEHPCGPDVSSQRYIAPGTWPFISAPCRARPLHAGKT